MPNCPTLNSFLPFFLAVFRGFGHFSRLNDLPFGSLFEYPSEKRLHQPCKAFCSGVFFYYLVSPEQADFGDNSADFFGYEGTELEE